MDDLLIKANKSDLFEALISFIVMKGQEWRWDLADLCAMMIHYSYSGFQNLDEADPKSLESVAFILDHFDVKECRVLADRLRAEAAIIREEEVMAAGDAEVASWRFGGMRNANIREEEAMAPGDAEVASWGFGGMCGCSSDPPPKRRGRRFSIDDEIPF
jgi:hypothetical protein